VVVTIQTADERSKGEIRTVDRESRN